MSDGPPRIRRAIGWLGSGVFASALLQYVLFFAAARHLGVVDYGVFSLALTMALLAAPFCDLGTGVWLVCEGSRRPEDLLRHFGASLLLRAWTVLPVAAAALGLGALAGYGTAFSALFLPLFVAAVADGVGNLCASACQAQERMATSALLQVARNVLRGLALLATVLAGGGPQALALAFAAASVLGAMPAVLVVLQRQRLPLPTRDVLPAVRRALPFGLAILATMLHAQSDVGLLRLYAGDGEVGLYHASTRFVLLLQMLPLGVAVATAPLSFRTGLLGIEPSARIYRIKITALASLGLLASLLLATNGDWIVRLCLGTKFQGSEVLLVALAPVVFVKFVSSSLGDTLAAISRQKLLTLGCWLALTVNVGANLLLLPAHGAMGAVIATLVSETLLLAFLAVNLLLAGLDLAWGRVLRHPIAAAAIAGAVAVLLSPRLAAPAAGAAVLLCLWLRPTEEERLLVRRGRGGAA
jgi:O-antigen/teichoic acid export membrane protein